MALKWAGSRVSMSVSQATTSVRLSCACERRGRKPAAPIAATPTVPFRNDRRSMRGLMRSEEHTSELQSHSDLVCRLLLEKKKICALESLRQLRHKIRSN